MTTKVVDFLNESGGSNFTENAPRPPTYGEENELQSNGGNSTKSSSSHKSHLSNKSHASSKSGTSTKGDHAHSPATTPRKSNLEGLKVAENMTHTSLCECEDSEMAAPLGFEPEGSAANSPPYSENGTPPHLKWAENLSYLLEDSEGVDLFQKFMDNELEGGSEVLQFWFACQGLKRKIGLNAVDKTIIDLQKVIYKRYVRSEKVKCISKEVKKDIAENVSTLSNRNKSIFDSAQEEVENYMRNVTYPAFLRSDSYVQYVQNYVESPKSSHSSGSNSARPISQSGLLPVVHEDKVLESKDFFSLPVMKAPLPVKRPDAFEPTVRRMETMTGSQLYNQRTPYPAHDSYAPVSAQDSELQSLSSDALTDDTISVTDSSVDGYHHPLRKKHHRKAVMKNLAQHNRELRTGLHSQIIPRTEHAPKDRNIAETEPRRFAELLIDKLTKVLEERETTAKMEEKLKSITSVEIDRGELFTDHVVLSKGNASTSFIPLIRPSAMEEETAESILDQHCSRIWASSSHHTPSYSPPGHQSPPHSKSPDRPKDARKKSIGVPAMGQNPYLSRSYKKRDFASVSHDSGIENCNLILCGTETHRHIHHHHHHHHTSRDSSSKKTLAEVEAQACGLGPWRAENPSGISVDYSQDMANRGRTNLRKSACGVIRKNSDTSSNIDSGISVMDSVKVPNWINPANERVMKWMLDNDTSVQEVNTLQDVDKTSSSHRRAQRLNQTAISAQQTRQSAKSKVCQRSTSVDRADRGAWNNPSIIMPSQPFAQDTSMPLLTPPNPTTQLEEAKRRLETQSKTILSSPSPAKSKSFTGMRPPPCGTPLPGANVRSLQPVDTSIASHSLDYRSGQPPHETIIGIYMGQEPIPYRHQLPGRAITLAQIKTLVTKRGIFKYYFKRQSDEFADGANAVFEEISDDNAVVPMWQGKIVVKVERLEL